MAATSSVTSLGLSETTSAALAHLDSRLEKLMPFTHTLIIALFAVVVRVGVVVVRIIGRYQG